ncbi:MAG: fluoride efflux transporter FluC [Halodesulfurarchaeum sp.]
MNTAGSFLLGLVTFLGMGNDLVLFFGTDVAGPFTTFSSFSVETVRLWEPGPISSRRERRRNVGRGVTRPGSGLDTRSRAWARGMGAISSMPPRIEK